MERRPLCRPATGARGTLLESEDLRRPATDRRCGPDSAELVWPRPALVFRRQAVDGIAENTLGAVSRILVRMLLPQEPCLGFRFCCFSSISRAPVGLR